MKSINITTSNLNVHKADAFLRSGEWFEDFVNRAGYDGIELTPLRSRLALEAQLGKLARGLVTSTHQSFVTSVRDLPFSLVMPTAKDSLEQLRHVQSHTPDTLPVVVYPNEQTPPGEYARDTDFTQEQGLGPKLWQATAEVFHRWDISFKDADIATESLKNTMRAKGLDGMVIDTFHSNDARRGIVPNWDVVLPHLAAQPGMIPEVHFSPARGDMGGDSNQLQATLQGQLEKTQAGRMLRIIKDNIPVNQDLTVVTEIPDTEFRQLGYRDLVATHRDVAEALREYLAD